MSPSYFATDIQPEKITLFLYMSEIESYNLRIEQNLKENDRNLRLFRIIISSPHFIGTMTTSGSGVVT